MVLNIEVFIKLDILLQSNMLSNKEDPIWVSAMLGHKSLNITLEKYTKFIRIDRKKADIFR